jgi:hypothetical protein
MINLVYALNPLYAAQDKKAGDSKNPKQTPPSAAVTKPADTTAVPGFVTNTGNLVTIGGGYYMPLGEMAGYLKPAWSVKLTYQDNQRGGTPIGLGADLVYSYPHDKEVRGGMMFITAAPHVSLIIPLFGAMDLQFKAGPGLTVLSSILDSGKKASADMTLHCGANISRVFAGAFYAGLGSDFYYIFERKNLRTLNTWFSMGYRW